MDEMRITYSMPREDQKILHELSLYACYGNELFETMTDTKSLDPPLSFEYDVGFTELTLRIEQMEYSRISESPTQDIITLLSNFDGESFLCPLMPPLNSVICFKYVDHDGESTLPKKLEIILDFKLRFSTRLAVAKKVMEREEVRLEKTWMKMEEIQYQINFFETFFGVEIFEFGGGVYKSKNKNMRIDCGLDKCTIF
jgi:hypothetical protein